MLSFFFSIGSELSENWLVANISLVKLKISLTMSSIAPNAFVGHSFKTINELEILGGKSEVLRLGVFNGLESIKSLKLLDSSFTGFDSNILDGISDTLVYFEFKQLTLTNKPVEIRGLTGGKPMQHLQEFKLYANLENIIKRNTFKALTNVTTLDLSNCIIESIGDGAFDEINRNVNVINLSRKSTKGGIQFVPDKLFDSILSSQMLEIKLENNNWKCDCQLAYFQECLKKYPKIFSGEFKCKSPDSLIGYNISHEQFCDSTTTTTTNTTTLETTTSTTTTTTADDDSNEFISQSCYDSNSNLVDFVNIKPRQQIMKLTDLKNGSITVEIEHIKNNLILIWFSQNNRYSTSISTHYPSLSFSINTLDCIVLKNRIITIDNFHKNTAYTLCLSDSKSVHVSPFDCISFVPSYRSSDEYDYVWLSQDVKMSFIALAVVGVILNIIFGVIIGVLVIRKYPRFLSDHKRIIKVNNLSHSKITSGILVMPNEYRKNE